jgi:hypothetical protein
VIFLQLLSVALRSVLFAFRRAQVLDLSKTIDQHFPALGSNCALKASTFINTLVLSQHEGGVFLVFIFGLG